MNRIALLRLIKCTVLSIVLTLACLEQTKAAGNFCADIFARPNYKIPVWEGDLVSKTSDSEVRFLGEGAMGKVDLIINGGNKYLIKTYEKSFRLENDLRAWEILNEASKTYNKIRVPNLSRISDNLLKIEYIPTTDLSRLAESQIDRFALKQLIDGYFAFIKSTTEKLVEMGATVISSKENYGLPACNLKFVNASGIETNIFLKADNLAPDPLNPGGFLVIDPY